MVSTSEVNTTEEDKSWSRRPHGAELKLRVLSECASPGASIARIAQAHGLNANLVHKWRRKAGVVLVKEAPRGARKGDVKSGPLTAIEDITETDKVEIAAGGFVALALPQPSPVEVPKPATGFCRNKRGLVRSADGVRPNEDD